jgi:hypothetical protein
MHGETVKTFRSLDGILATVILQIFYFTLICDNDATKQAASVIYWRYAELNVNNFFTLHKDE